MGRFRERVALVTGGASGIGEAVVRRFVADGGRAVLLDVDEARAGPLCDELGDTAVFRRHDITAEADWQATADWAAGRFGQWHVLVNSAGVSMPGSIEDADSGLWQTTHRINAEGVFLGCKYAVAAMKASAEPCAIVNISSTYGLRPGPDQVSYSSSKASVIAVTRSVALHCAQAGYPIRCNAINPGAIHTPMMQSYLDNADDPDGLYAFFASVHPMQRVGQPDEVANAVLFLASDEASYITGVSLPVDGGYCAM